MKLNDLLAFDTKRTFTDEGFLALSARVSKVGVQDYALASFDAGDLPERLKGEDSNKVVRLFRPEDEVFKEESLSSISNKPVTDSHPTEFVNSRNVKDVQIGFSKDKVEREGNFVRADLVVQDQAAIDRIQHGKNQVSLGYSLKVDWTSGTDERFGAYDGIQRDIKVNHIAIVTQGRAGPEVKLDDTQEKKTMSTKVIDGITVEFSDQAAEAYDKLQTALDEKTESAKELEAKLADSVKAADELQGKLDAEVQKNKEATSVEVIDSKVAARVALIDSARKLHGDVETDGKSDLEIKVAAIQHVSDAYQLEDKSEDYVNGVFESLLVQPKKENDKLADALKEGNEPKMSARERMIARRGGQEVK